MNEDTFEFNLKYCKIRPNKNFNNMARAETPWSVEIGLFKDYLKEKKKTLIDKCFESDWSNMKAGSIKFKKSTELEVKQEMHRIYPLLREAYKVQAGYGGKGNTACVGQNQLLLFLKDLGCLDEEGQGNFGVADMGRTLIAVDSGRPRTTTNPADALIRLQLMEFFIRAAQIKFPPVDGPELDSIKKFNSTYIEPVLSQQ